MECMTSAEQLNVLTSNSGLHLLLFLKLQFEEKPRKLLFLHLWACFCFLFTVEIPQTFLQARSSRPGRSMGSLSSTLARLLRIKMLCQVTTSSLRTKNLSQDSIRPQLGIPQGKQCLALIQPISTSPLWVAHKTACLKSVATASRDQCFHGNHSFSIVTLHLIHKTCSCLHCKKYNFYFLSRFPVQISKNYYIKIHLLDKENDIQYIVYFSKTLKSRNLCFEFVSAQKHKWIYALNLKISAIL